MRFSVVIPTFNRGPLLMDAVSSVLAQDCGDCEVIVADDGSTDDTRERLAARGGALRYARQDNRGPAAAKNLGIGMARGEIVGFLDSDDMWEPDTLSAVARLFAEHPAAGLVAVGAREIEADGTRTERCYGKRSPGDRYSTRGLLRHDPGGCSWYFVRRELLERVGRFDEALRSAEECDLALRLSFECEMFALRRPLLLRRKHDGNLSDDVLLNARCWLRLLEKLRAAHPEFVARHPWVFRRAVGKERLRLGRELLARAGGDPQAARQARRELGAALRAYPLFTRAAAYLAWSALAPRGYARWRERELRARRRRAR